MIPEDLQKASFVHLLKQYLACGKFSSLYFSAESCNNLPVCGTLPLRHCCCCCCYSCCAALLVQMLVGADSCSSSRVLGEGVSHPSCTKRSPTGVTEAEPPPPFAPLPPGDAECFLQTQSSKRGFLRVCRKHTVPSTCFEKILF